MADVPEFDPSQPFEAAPAGPTPEFDPSKPFTPAPAPAAAEPPARAWFTGRPLPPARRSIFGNVLGPAEAQPPTYEEEVAKEQAEQSARAAHGMQYLTGATPEQQAALADRTKPYNSDLLGGAKALYDIAAGATRTALAYPSTAISHYLGRPAEYYSGIPKEELSQAAQLATGIARVPEGMAALGAAPDLLRAARNLPALPRWSETAPIWTGPAARGVQLATGKPLQAIEVGPRPAPALEAAIARAVAPPPPVDMAALERDLTQGYWMFRQPAEPMMQGRPGRDPNVRLLPPDVSHNYRPEVGAARTAAVPGPVADASPETLQWLDRVFERQQMTPGNVEQLKEEMSPQQMFAEATPDMEGEARGIHSMPGQGRNELMQSVSQRHEESLPRTEAFIDRALGENVNKTEWEAEIERLRAQQSNPFWRRFDSTAVSMTPELENVLSRPDMIDALRKANRSLANRNMPATNGFVIPGEDGPEIVRVPTTRAMQLARMHLNDAVRTAVNNGEGTRASEFMTLRNDLTNAVDNHPDQNVAGVWKPALRSWAEPSAMIDARKTGEDLLKPSTHETEVPGIVEAMSDPQRRAAEIGLRNYLSDVARRKGTLERRSGNVLTEVASPANQSKIRSLIGDDRADELFASVAQEVAMRDAPRRLLVGARTSPTAEVLAYQRQWLPKDMPVTPEQMAAGVVSPIETAKGWAIKRAIKGITGRAAAAQEEKNLAIRKEAARILNLQGAERDAAYDFFMDRQLARQGQSQAVPPAAPGAAAAAAPLQRVPTKVAPTGRAMYTQPFRTDRDQAILEAGVQRATENSDQGGAGAGAPRQAFAAGGQVSSPPLKTRIQSHYSPDRGTAVHRCELCEMFRAPYSCTAVAGFIARRGGCDWFMKNGKGLDYWERVERGHAHA